MTEKSLKEILANILKCPMVIESGTEGIWTWRKWSDGTAECWGRHSWVISEWKAWGNLYESTSTYANYPSNLFTSAPSLFVTSATILNGALASIEIWSGASNTRTPSIIGVRGNVAGTGYTAYVDLHAIGKWK